MPIHRESLRFEGVAPARQQHKPRPGAAVRPERRPSGPPDPLAVAILASAGLDPQHYRPESLNRRIPACLRALGADSRESALRKLQSHPRLLPKAVDALLLGVTHFFRDATVFDAIDRVVLPDLATRHHPLTIWSAACSDGHELYSVALLVHRHHLLHRTRLLGTDCRADALEVARAGTYDAAAIEPVPTDLRSHFRPHTGLHRISPEIRHPIQWQHLDLLAARDVGHWDMILWRNMAIYLHADTAARVWTLLAGSLQVGGYLITGKAERPLAGLPLQRVEPCIYRRIARTSPDRRIWL